MPVNKNQFSHRFQNQITNSEYFKILTEKSTTVDTAMILKIIKNNNIKWKNGDKYFIPSEEDIKNEILFLGYMCITENFTNLSSRGFILIRSENDISFKFDILDFEHTEKDEINIALKQLLHEGSIFRTSYQEKYYYNARKKMNETNHDDDGSLN
jgi:hypothetical protein